MPLTSQQRAALEKIADERGVDRAELIAEAEAMSGGGEPERGGEKPGKAPSAEKPKLFMYLLPFVTVREVRQVWLELTDSFPGDGEVAAKWAAKFAGASGGSSPPLEDA